MINELEHLFVTKDNYDLFLKNVEEKLSDESKLSYVLEELKEKIVDGIRDLNIKENDSLNILTIVLTSVFFAPQGVFICDVHLVKDKEGKVLVKY
ncbi:hypothetical protein ACWN6Y_09635 [Vagococcus teuberi]|uniref:Uncharacterized protein n=1 Tax=Vagococcus teuberi TaxID=519472 RepID=A0A1J0A3I4_9ENTE|nr:MULTISPECIES: hypothetical protein [Vagococcus]APB30493.1 hypothetical protein BHY08_00820 [Vagococcus teuberi]RHH65936.1 hypothetical protein DW196_11035 [Vagococcus sp. AM17-17]